MRHRSPAEGHRTRSRRRRAGHSRSLAWHARPPDLPASRAAGRDSSGWLAAPSRRRRRRCCRPAALYRVARPPPFAREVRIDALAEPGFLVTPPQAFVDEDLADPAPAHRNTVLGEIGD